MWNEPRLWSPERKLPVGWFLRVIPSFPAADQQVLFWFGVVFFSLSLSLPKDRDILEIAELKWLSQLQPRVPSTKDRPKCVYLVCKTWSPARQDSGSTTASLTPGSCRSEVIKAQASLRKFLEGAKRF